MRKSNWRSSWEVGKVLCSVGFLPISDRTRARCVLSNSEEVMFGKQVNEFNLMFSGCLMVRLGHVIWIGARWKGSVLSRGSANPTVNDRSAGFNNWESEKYSVSLQYRALLEYKGTTRLTITQQAQIPRRGFPVRLVHLQINPKILSRESVASRILPALRRLTLGRRWLP